MRTHNCLAAFLTSVTLSLSSCSTNKTANCQEYQNYNSASQSNKNRISYKLEELCDTPITEKNLTLNVYISPSEVLWDYRDYRDELFFYVKEFFAEQEVNCKLNYSTEKFHSFLKPNEIGVEIYDSDSAYEQRYFELALFTNEKEKIKSTSGYALSESGIALVNGAWEEWRSFMSREEVEAQFSETYRDVPKKEYLMKLNAGLICHEVLHCTGLFHPNTFNPQPVSPYLEEIPNIMSYYPPNFSQTHILGAGMSTLQKQLLHSFLIGNNNYNAVRNSKSFDEYLEKIAEANELILN